MKKYKLPKKAVENAKLALYYKKKYPNEVKAMTPVGWARARQIASGKPLTPKTIKRIANFNRHRKNAKIEKEHKGKPWRDNGFIAWKGWGGTSGVNAAKKYVKEYNL